MSAPVTVVRSTVTFTAAHALVAAAIRAANSSGVRISVVVADAAGELLAAGRSDGASVLSTEVAAHKAWTAANVGAPTSAVASFVASDADAAVYMPTVPRFVAIPGGFPLVSSGETVGALGVSGGSTTDDVAIAEAAMAAGGF